MLEGPGRVAAVAAASAALGERTAVAKAPASVRGEERGASRAVSAAVAKFAVSGAVCVLLVGLAEGWLLQRQGIDEAVRDARASTEVLGHAVIEPALASGITSRDPAAIALVDSVVREVAFR